MTFQHIGWFYLIVPLLAALVALRFWRRHYWGHSLVEHLAPRLGNPNPLFRLPAILEGLAVVFLLVALLGPVYPFVLNRIERGGLQIMFVVDLSQSMEENMQRGVPPPRPQPSPTQPGAVIRPGSKMEAVKASAIEFVRKRPGDAIGVVVFSNNAYLVTPATFDHESLGDYLQMVSTQTLINEGFTGIGEGLYMASNYFRFSKTQKERDRRTKGQVIVLFSDGDYNYGRDPMKEIEKSRYDGTRVYFIGVSLEQGASQQIRDAVPSTGGKFFDVTDPRHLEEAFAEINRLEKGRFYATELVRHQPAYFIFALLSFLALTARMAINAIPHFVEIS
ncbi:MAG: VWA domain-containing protein [Acidobacteria bacterium]|nr:VWA domain-containing protein [Acidobacteriota bacterium]